MTAPSDGDLREKYLANWAVPHMRQSRKGPPLSQCGCRSDLAELEREAGRNIELMWLTGKLAPYFKTIADFRHDNPEAIRIACQRFVAICRALGLAGTGMVAIDGSRFRAVNTHEKNYTKGKLARRKAETGAPELIALADRGCYEGEQIRACAAAGITPMVPKPNTSPARPAALGASRRSFISLAPIPIAALPVSSSKTASPPLRPARSSTSTSIRRPAVPVHPEVTVRQAKRSASGDGSMKPCSMPCTKGSMQCPLRWTSGAALSNTSSAH
jgi:hypothetical protein